MEGKKEFTLPEILGGMHGYLLEEGGFDRIHELIECVYGSPICTHQISSIADEFTTALAKRFPKLYTPKMIKEISKLVRSIKTRNKLNEICRWNKLIARYGNSFIVEPLIVIQPDFEQGLENKKVILIIER